MPARTDQCLGHYDASVRAHVDGRVSPGDALQAAFRTSTGSSSFRRQNGLGRGKPLTRRRLARAGSPVAFQSPAAYGPGPPRSAPSTRGSERKRAGFSNLNRRPEVGVTLVSTRRRPPGNSRCAPTSSGISDWDWHAVCSYRRRGRAAFTGLRRTSLQGRRCHGACRRRPRGGAGRGRTSRGDRRALRHRRWLSGGSRRRPQRA